MEQSLLPSTLLSCDATQRPRTEIPMLRYESGCMIGLISILGLVRSRIKYPGPGPVANRLHLSTLGNNDIGDGPVISIGPGVFNHLDNVHALDHLTKHDVFVVQVRGWHSGDEELAAIGVRPGVGHTQQAWLIMFELEVFVLETAQTPNGGRAGTVAIDKVAALEHEIFDLSLFLVNTGMSGLTSCICVRGRGRRGGERKWGIRTTR